ncbi:hypothetical protein AB0L00_17240 [Actinoallomurus sp. NPDC052308]|uniref:hypothetical protein n=1 Tax=Actinoallomurus sp. NPDC052308 TaxID=3155530 RepID=UPI003422EDED
MSGNAKRFDQPGDDDANASVLWYAAQESGQVDVQAGGNGNSHTITTVNAGQTVAEIKEQVRGARG